jgi:hypothetical protein
VSTCQTFCVEHKSFSKNLSPSKEPKKVEKGKERKKNEEGKTLEEGQTQLVAEAKNDAGKPDAQQEAVKYLPPPLPKLGCLKHIADWIHIVSCLMQWHQQMKKQPTTMQHSQVTTLATGI